MKVWAAAVLWAVVHVSPAQPAIAYGEGGCGKLVGGDALPCAGEGFEAFTPEACNQGRNHLHPLVAATVGAAYAALRPAHPARRWQYGDLGHREGGPLPPHRTHQNGLAADFFVPLRDAQGAPARVPIAADNQYGYGLELDGQGKLGALEIDWKALADHLRALEAAGASRGVRITRIFLTPPFQQRLFETGQLPESLRSRFPTKEAWVRHDEHYHVDFEIPAVLRRPWRCR